MEQYKSIIYFKLMPGLSLCDSGHMALLGVRVGSKIHRKCAFLMFLTCFIRFLHFLRFSIYVFTSMYSTVWNNYDNYKMVATCVVGGCDNTIKSKGRETFMILHACPKDPVQRKNGTLE